LRALVVPDQAIPFGAGPLRLVDREAVHQLPLVVVLVGDPSPVDPAGEDLGAEGGVLAAGAGQDAEEPPAVAMDIGHALGRGQLAVGDVGEVRPAGELAEEVPGVAMRAVVGGVAAPHAELHRHGAVAGDGEDVEQLLEVGAMVLVVAPGGGQPQPAPQGPLPIGGLVVAVEGDGGRVVVQLVELDLELADGMDDDGQGEGRDVGVEEAVEAAAGAIVVERSESGGGQAEELGDMACGPLTQPVEGLAGDEEVLEQQQQPGGGGDATAAVLAREVVAEDRVESEPVEESVEDRQGGDGVGAEGAAGGAGDPAGPGRRGVLPAGAGGLARHERSPRCVDVGRDHDGRRSAAGLTAMTPRSGVRSRGEEFWERLMSIASTSVERPASYVEGVVVSRRANEARTWSDIASSCDRAKDGASEGGPARPGSRRD
jgi:hypothetical protein